LTSRGKVSLAVCKKALNDDDESGIPLKHAIRLSHTFIENIIYDVFFEQI